MHLALVCKSFQRWVTPRLYRDIALCGELAFDKFLETMASNPSLGQWVLGIWIGPLSNEFLTPTVEHWQFMRRIEIGLIQIFSRAPHLKRLALINLPPMSSASWLKIEEALPSGLEYLAAGPDHAVFNGPAHFHSLKWFCSIDTPLTHSEFDTLCEMKQLQNFHWCFIQERIDLQSVRCLTHLLASHPWNNVCLYLIEREDNISTGFSEDLEIELVTLYEDKRVKKYQLFHVEDWTKAFFKHWTEDWA